mgnify:CR=1 FL=1
MEQFPIHLYPIQKKFRDNVKVDPQKRYPVRTLILFFFTFSLAGWIWEVVLTVYKSGVFVNRGVLYGPWLPIYGSGGLLILISLRKLFDRPFITFFSVMVLCSFIEYISSWFLEYTTGQRWWDYEGYFLNLNGRICLAGAVAFGIGGISFIYVFAPLLDRLYAHICKQVQWVIAIILMTAFCIDLSYSYLYPNMGEGVTTQLFILTKYICGIIIHIT